MFSTRKLNVIVKKSKYKTRFSKKIHFIVPFVIEGKMIVGLAGESA